MIPTTPGCINPLNYRPLVALKMPKSQVEGASVRKAAAAATTAVEI
jgi:hypothetical protein